MNKMKITYKLGIKIGESIREYEDKLEMRNFRFIDDFGRRTKLNPACEQEGDYQRLFKVIRLHGHPMQFLNLECYFQ